MRKRLQHKLKQYVRPYKLNLYFALIYRLFMAMIFMQQSRIAFYVFNHDLFQNTSVLSLFPLMFGGIVFDLTSVLYVNSLFIFLQVLPFRFTTNLIYQKCCKWVFIVTNSAAIAANMADVAYYRFTMKRTTGLVFQEFANEQNFGSLFLQFFLDYWYIFILTGMMITGLTVTYRLASVRPLKIRRKLYYYPFALVMMLFSVTLFIGGVRGGFAHSTRPITISNATQYIKHLGEENIVLNTPFSIIRTFGEVPLKRVSYFTETELDSIYSPIHKPIRNPIYNSIDNNISKDTSMNTSKDISKDTSKDILSNISSIIPMNKRNVVVFIVESLGSEYIGKYNENKNIANYEGYTPFLDSLLDHSIYFTESEASGKKSIDGMASILASIPSLIRPYILTPYSHNKIKSLPRILKDEGYGTSFFHGAPNGSMGMLAYSKKIEIKDYYGLDEYNDWREGNSDFDGIWGVWDSKFLEFFSDKLNQFEEPFFSSIFTLSSHHPFKVPKEDIGKYKSGGLDMHQVIGYTDNALREFFERAKEQDWYKNTIFVITGDHTNQSKYPFYKSTNGLFRVPVIIFDPMSEINGAREKVASQIDILPTVLGYLNYNKPFFSFGYDLLNGDDNFAVNHFNGAYNIYYENYLLIFDGNKTIALYDMNKDMMQTKDIKNENISVRNLMESKIKAFIQQFNNRMIDDNLSINE